MPVPEVDCREPCPPDPRRAEFEAMTRGLDTAWFTAVTGDALRLYPTAAACADAEERRAVLPRTCR
ncbi:MAG: hypothetical protein ABMB14_26345 [Myxococcota bacterium]